MLLGLALIGVPPLIFDLQVLLPKQLYKQYALLVQGRANLHSSVAEVAIAILVVQVPNPWLDYILEERITSIIIISVAVSLVNCPMAKLCRNFQAYLVFPSSDSANREQSSDVFRFGVNSRSSWKESVDQNENEKNSDEGEGKDSEKRGDSWSLCEPANRSFESLLERTSVSSAQPYSTVQQKSNHNSCTNDGLRSCTESLGFESSDEREDCGSYVESSSNERAEFDNDKNENDCRKELDAVSGAAMRDGGIRRAHCHGHVGTKKGGACFPPPLSSMAPNGQPWVFLKPLRKDGRFLLQEVKLPRHECLQAWRQDGRLRLQLVIPSDQHAAVITRADGCVEGSNTCASSTCDGEKWAASLEEEHAHVERFRHGAAVDASLALYQEALGMRCHANTKCMTSTWKPRCITT